MAVRQEQSYGIVPLRKAQGRWQTCLVQLHAGHWGFPKGHVEELETPEETASRELFEETGLTVQHILSSKTMQEEYFFKFQGKLIHKKVDYFLASVTGEVCIQAAEISNYQWLNIENAEQVVTYSATKQVCKQALSLIHELTL